MKKILILYAKYGGGHYSAAKAIQKHLDNTYNVETELIDFMEYANKILNSITIKAYNKMAKDAPRLWGKIYAKSQRGILGGISTSANKLMSSKINKLLKQTNPDIVVSTHPFSSQMVSYLKQKGKISCKLVTVLTDFAPHDQWLIGHKFANDFCVSNEKMQKYLLNYGINKEKIHVTGIPLSDKFLETFDKSKIFKEFELNENNPVILFFGGGEFGLGKSTNLQILNALIHNLPTYQIIAISGKNKKMNEKFNELVKNANATNRVKVFDYTNKVPELMSISSLVVTKPGGLTTSESLASSLPILIINPIPGQEEENAEFLENNHVGVWLKNTDNIDEFIQNLFSDDAKLKNMKENTKLVAKKNSTSDICKIIMEN